MTQFLGSSASTSVVGIKSEKGRGRFPPLFLFVFGSIIKSSITDTGSRNIYDAEIYLHIRRFVYGTYGVVNFEHNAIVRFRLYSKSSCNTNKHNTIFHNTIKMVSKA